MTQTKLNLLAALSSSACALIWLANCVLDVTYGIEPARQIALHALSTVVWTACAGIWWARWRRDRRVSAEE